MGKNRKRNAALLITVSLLLCLLPGCTGKGSTGSETAVHRDEQTKDLIREELLFGDIWLCGQKIDFPCRVKDLPEEVNIAWGADKGYGGYYDFSSGYEEFYIHAFDHIESNVNIRGATGESSKEELISVIGEADDLLDKNLFRYYLCRNSKKHINFYYNPIYVGELEITIYYRGDEKDEQ